MKAYYNEFNRKAADGLRELIHAGFIADGDVDERSITEVRANEIKGYTQCHFFAGIGGWSAALRLAGWPDSRPVWTGSPPCQDYSIAGGKKRQLGQRHLSPHFARLIAESGIATVYGEQVASAIAAGWWDDLAADLEAADYAVAAAVLPACSVRAPHQRNRLYFVAHSNLQEHQRRDTLCYPAGADEAAARAGQEGWLERQRKIHVIADGSPGYWSDAEPVLAADGYNRLLKPGLRVLVDGLSDDMDVLHLGFGNAIVPQVAAEFIRATM